MELNLLTIDAARSAIQERKTTSMALVESFYARIQKEDSAIGAYLTLTKERALEQADRWTGLQRKENHCLRWAACRSASRT